MCVLVLAPRRECECDRRADSGLEQAARARDGMRGGGGKHPPSPLPAWFAYIALSNTESVHIKHYTLRKLCTYSLLFSALYAIPYYLVLYMQTAQRSPVLRIVLYGDLAVGWIGASPSLRHNKHGASPPRPRPA